MQILSQYLVRELKTVAIQSLRKESSSNKVWGNKWKKKQMKFDLVN